MTVGRAGEEQVELTLQPDALQRERKEEREVETVVGTEVGTKVETEVRSQDDGQVERQEERQLLEEKARVDETKITLAEISSKMKRAISVREWGVMESLKNQWNPAWKVLKRHEPESGWEAKWYQMNVDASLHLGQAMASLRRFGVVEQVVGGPGTMAKVPPTPDDLGWSPERVAQWFLLRASSRIEQKNWGGVKFDLEEAERLAKRAIDRWGRKTVAEVERLKKVARKRRERR